jgi:hypothetical protein
VLDSPSLPLLIVAYPSILYCKLFHNESCFPISFIFRDMKNVTRRRYLPQVQCGRTLVICCTKSKVKVNCPCACREGIWKSGVAHSLISALDGFERSASCPDCFTPG